MQGFYCKYYRHTNKTLREYNRTIYLPNKQNFIKTT